MSIAVGTNVLLSWIAAATLVVAAHAELEPHSRIVATAVTIAAIVGTAAIYMRLGARSAGTTHALGAGIAWLVLSIASELTMTACRGEACFALLGSPAHPLLRNVYLFVWIFAPVLFVRADAER